MSWIYEIGTGKYFNEEKMQNNAYEFYLYFSDKGATLESICGMLGNIQRESTINPGIKETESETSGWGLIQWTPSTVLRNWCTQYGYNWYDGIAQCERIWNEGTGEKGANGYWLPTQDYSYSWLEFIALTDVHESVYAYLYERERAGVIAIEERLSNADKWYQYLSQLIKPYIPRLTSDGIVGNHWYYEDNPFYQSGYGLPNCTCYAWGRRAELLDKAPNLSTGNADTFWEYNQNTNAYPYGTTPKLGAIICWRYTGTHSNDGGHVAVVEQINDDGTIITSNSAYGGTFFYTQTLSSNNGYEWSDYTELQGFIYLPNDYNPPQPQPVKRKKLPLYMMLRRRL